ncbi:MAG: neuraminidase-like domain-containing protein, partial [Bacteroidota bacterium]
EYYQQTYDGTWSACQKIDLDIGDAKVYPIFWKGRLFLFWATVIEKKAVEDKLNLKEGKDENENPNDTILISDSGKKIIEVNLNWSEYYNDKWLPKRTSDFKKPFSFISTSSNVNVDLSLAVDNNDHLAIFVNKVDGQDVGGFLLANKYVAIRKREGEFDRVWTPRNNDPSDAIQTRLHEYLFTHKQKVSSYRKIDHGPKINFTNNEQETNDTHKLITYHRNRLWPLDFHHPIVNAYKAPFFSYDQQYIFFVTIDDAQEEDDVDYYYKFHNFFHPYVEEFTKLIYEGDLTDLLDIETQKKKESFFDDNYTINSNPLLSIESSDKKVDFEVEAPYALYNWELFYHIPLATAVQLVKNQRFADAQRWFHFIFNPITDKPEEDSGRPTQRFWNFLPFHEGTTGERITRQMEQLAVGEANENFKNSIQRWREVPFSAHEVAKFRPLAYQFHVVMKYLDMLIAWGDKYFRELSIESINLATQKYVLARNILGPRPERVPRLSKRPIRTYRDLKGNLDEFKFGNVLVEMENEFPLNFNIPSSSGDQDDRALNTVLGISRQLYFCIPHNKKLLEYWDMVDDRLFKIRNCMDIEGNVVQLPLFQPPIPPGLVASAA